jgi:AmmeMemoRadiSam system protein A
MNAARSATRDYRFSPVAESELEGLQIEVSVLTEPVRLEAASPSELLSRLRPGVDGVVLTVEGRTSTFLPQVWEELPDKEQFMRHLSRKAGCDADVWRMPGARVSVYAVEHFEEGR